MNRRYVVSGITRPCRELPDRVLIGQLTGLKPDEITDLIIRRESIDGRRRPPVYQYTVEIETSIELKGLAPGPAGFAEAKPIETLTIPRVQAATGRTGRPLIVGFGPAGMFAALYLVHAGYAPIIIEAGKPITERDEDVRAIHQNRVLAASSNIVMGEGGSGTYSDGKLTARTRNKYTNWIFERLIEFGADPEIRYLGRPHLGTDRLKQIIPGIRQFLLDHGAEIHYNRRVTRLLIDKKKAIAGVGGARYHRTTGEHEFRSDTVILAAGQNDDRLYHALAEAGANIKPKPFAIGVRIEHSREFLDRIQYGKNCTECQSLEYSLTHQMPDGRGVYSFCVCPGGEIVCASDRPGILVINGMSNSLRNLPFTNAGLVVSVGLPDLGTTYADALRFRQTIEEKAFQAGGSDFTAPGQRVSDFMKNIESTDLPETSYRPGIRSIRMESVLPDFVLAGLRAALPGFNHRFPGFIEHGLLLAPETRTSSPVRIIRNKVTRQVEGISGLYFCGDGSGHSGGIISAAADGVMTAEALAARIE